jgi:hypothetical protein
MDAKSPDGPVFDWKRQVWRSLGQWIKWRSIIGDDDL